MSLIKSVAVLTIVCATIWTAIGLPVLPILDTSSGIDSETIEQLRASVNDSPKNLYVVKAVVYEVGILTEEDDNETSIESQERVDLTFFDAHVNDSHINLGNIPLPIQTNVTGQVLTGIAPVNIGAFSSPSELLSSLPLTGTIVNLTHSDTAFFQLTTHNSSQNQHRQVLTEEDVAKIPEASSLFKSSPTTTSDASSSDTTSSDDTLRNSVPTDDESDV